MTKTWPDPARPGVPLNPERDGWHWVETPDGERVPYEWRSAGECERGRWPSYWVSQGEDCWEAPACKYLGPALMPDEAAYREDVKWHEGYAVGVLDVRRGTAFGEPDPHYAALQKRCEEAERERDALATARRKGMEMPPEFLEWMKREMPSGTHIHNPEWWASRVWKAAIRAAAKEGK